MILDLIKWYKERPQYLKENNVVILEHTTELVGCQEGYNVCISSISFKPIIMYQSYVSAIMQLSGKFSLKLDEVLSLYIGFEFVPSSPFYFVVAPNMLLHRKVRRFIPRNKCRFAFGLHFIKIM